MQSHSHVTRRSFLRLAGGVTAGMVVAACAPATAPSAGPGGAPAAERAALIFWAPQHFITEQNDFFTESVELAAAANDFDVDVQLFPWGEYHQKQNAAIEAGTLPDALLGVSVSQHYAMGILSDISDVFAEVGAAGGGFFEPDTLEVTIGGAQYALPFHNEPQMMYYRTDIMAEAGYTEIPQSLDEFVAVADAITNADARIWGFGNPYTMVPDGNNFTQLLVFAFGGRIQDETGNVVINSPETIAALEWSASLLNDHVMMPPGVTGWDDTGNNQAFMSGQCAIVYNSGSILNAMRGDDPGWLEATQIGPLPMGPAGYPITFNGGSAAGLMKSSRYPDQAKRLLAGIMAPERYPGNLSAANGMFFPTLQNYNDLPIYTEDPWNKQIIETVPYAYVAFAPGAPTPWIDEVNAKFLFAEMAVRVAVDGWSAADAVADFERQALESKEKFEQA